jgi:speckle-type POZ protein
MAPVILAAADRYRLEDLKTWYETRLTRQMLSKNCFEQLSLTTHHPAESMVM